ncbi:hypothetical protein QBC35DRAFT_544117 [Podospora australis]|uniref:Uncharacterized protein n=1 Tax=Podospora australis TaxID=1536484 RepID=A0AAN6WYJ1_9PEZI|nr:hypothetical protein QBC35DRAFT_544117 [Podospora australis]
MQVVGIDLGNIEVIPKNSYFSLTLSASCSLSLPSAWKATPDAIALSQASSAGDIWISKAGSCQIEFSTLLNGSPFDESIFGEEAIPVVAHLAAECRVWQNIGLELRAKHTPKTYYAEDPTTSAYLLHHPDLSSGLIAPSHIPGAGFEGLKCVIDYQLHTEGPEDPPDWVDHTALEPSSPDRHLVEVPPNHAHNLRRNPRRSKKAEIAQEDLVKATSKTLPLSGSCSKSARQNPDEGQTVVSNMEFGIEGMSYLLDTALRKLLGIKKASPGLKTTRSIEGPSLIDIAPAVWNLSYLQSMAAHAKIIPTISSGIARLKNARSARLREKLDRFAGRQSFGDSHPQRLKQDDYTQNDINERLWLQCQTTIREDPSKRPNAQGEQDRPPEKRPKQFEYSGWELAEYSPQPTYADDDDANDLSWEEHNRYHDLESAESHYSGVDRYQHDEETHAVIIAYDDGHDELTNEMLAEVDNEDTGSHLPTYVPFEELEDEPSAVEITDSSEGDYFYTDGYGNIIPFHEPPMSYQEEPGWEQRLQQAGSLEHEDHEYRQMDELEDEELEQRYIMYHEMQHWAENTT